MSNQAYDLGFARVGQDVTVWPLARIVSAGTISLGDSVIIDDFVLLMGGTRTVIGSFVHIASFVSIVGGGEFIMEDFAGLSGGTRVYTGSDDFLGGSLTGPTIPSPYRIPVRSFVHVGRHAIVGANSVILPGVTVGEGAAIGAGSVVTKDCKPWTVHAGAPCRALKPRPRARMLELEAEFRKEAFDEAGVYIPKARRTPRDGG